MLGGLLAAAMVSCNPKEPIPTEVSEDTYAPNACHRTGRLDQSVQVR